MHELFLLPLIGIFIVAGICFAIMARLDHAKQTGPGNYGKPHKEATPAQLAQAWREKDAERAERNSLRGGVHLQNSHSRFDRETLDGAGYGGQ